MPKIVEKCVNKVKRTVKPRNPKQNKTSAAWAICTSAQNKKRKKRKRIKL